MIHKFGPLHAQKMFLHCKPMELKRVSDGVPPNEWQSIPHIGFDQSDICYSPSSSFYLLIIDIMNVGPIRE